MRPPVGKQTERSGNTASWTSTATTIDPLLWWLSLLNTHRGNVWEMLNGHRRQMQWQNQTKLLFYVRLCKLSLYSLLCWRAT